MLDEIQKQLLREIADLHSVPEGPFHQMLLNNQLPLTMGGGIGQSRLCMLMIGTCHIGEVQSSLWDEATRKACEDAGVLLL